MSFRIRAIKCLDSSLGRILACVIPASIVKPEVAIRSLLFIRPGGIGDAIHLIPSLRAIKAVFPQIQIDILAEKRNAAVFELCSAVSNTYEFDSPLQFINVFCRRYDAIIDTEQWHRLSAVTARLLRSPLRAGFATNERGRLFGHRIEYFHDMNEAENFHRLLAPLGINSKLDYSQPFLEIPLVSLARAAEEMSVFKGRPFVVFAPGASIAERRWGTDNFRDLARRVNCNGMPVAVVGGGNDRSDGDKIIRGLKGFNFAGRLSLTETAAIIDRSTLMVSGDSGVLHIAVGLGKRTISLFGPGIIAKWAPRGPEHIVINKNLPCSPCTRFGYTPRCPHGAECMQSINAEEIAGAIFSLLQCQNNQITTSA